MNYNYALFCRGFVFSDKKIESPKEDWKNFSFEYCNKTYSLWYDSKNQFSYKREDDNMCLIMGYAMDTIDWHMEIDLICKNLINNLKKSLNNFYEYIDNLNGRFIIIYGHNQNLYALNDATAMRSVYYHEKECIIASHYEIIAGLTKDANHPFYEIYNKIQKNRPWTLPGDLTPYKNIKILLANHEIDLQKLNIRRFYPRENHKETTLDEILTILPNHLKNQMITLAKYTTPIISTTAGNDSKLTISACKEIKDKCVFFTFVNESPNLKDYNQFNRFKDYNYAKKISEVYNLNFKTLKLKHSLNDEMLKIVKRNHYHQHIPGVIQEYLNELPNGIHVQSNLIEIIRDLTYVYPKPPKHNSPQEIMSGWMMYWSIRHEIKDIINDFWKRNQWDEIFDYERVRLFYWEQRMSAWNNAATLLENDWAFNTYMLLNCRKLLEFGFCEPKIIRDKNLIVKLTTKKLWPELLYYIENSEDSLFDLYKIDKFNEIRLKNNITFNTNSNNKIFKIIGLYETTFGFDKKYIKKDDYCELKVNKEVIDKEYIQININVLPNMLIEKSCLYVYIKINENEIYSEDITNLINNPLIINKKLDLDKFDSLIIGMKCINEINSEEYGNYAVLNIGYINLSGQKYTNIISL